METKTITTTVTKETHELGIATSSLIKGIAAAKENDGKISVIEVFELVKDSWGDLVAAVDGIKLIPAEAKENPMATIRGFIIPTTEAVEALIK